MLRLSAVHILLPADTFLMEQALDRNTLAEILVAVLVACVCNGESQVVPF